MGSTTPLQLRLPTELLRFVILQYFELHGDERTFEVPQQSYKIPWKLVEPLALTSKVVRHLTMEMWFEVFYARSPDDLLKPSWPEFGIWTRELHCVDLGTDVCSLPIQWNLASFHRLRKLRVDFNPAQSNAMLLMRFDYPRNIASQIQELEVYDISWPSPMTLQLIASSFPNLRVLKMSQDLIWCNLCNTCCFATFKDHPPESIIYDKVPGLSTHYAEYLRPLSRLRYVTISIRYGLEGKTCLNENNDSLWSGECDACMDMMYDNSSFQDDWVCKKRISERPPSLESVTWRFRYKDQQEVIIDVPDEAETPVLLTADEIGDAFVDDTESGGNETIEH